VTRNAIFVHEYGILRVAKGSYLTQAHELTRIGDLPALVLKDIGGQSLDRSMPSMPAPVLLF